jgi:predicted O-methyltransferase YrrM
MGKSLDKLNAFIKLIRHNLFSRYRKGHGVHSPAVYSFVSEVLYSKTSDNEVGRVIRQVEKMLSNDIIIDFKDFGAGSFRMKGNKRKLKDIVRFAGINKKYGKLLYRIINYYKPLSLIELGTSAGVSTLYLGLGMQPHTQFVTVEANMNLSGIARANARELGFNQIQFLNKTFENALPGVISNLKSPTVVFIDGNHKYQSTLNYYKAFSESISEGLIIIGDIYWSMEMEEAWKVIQNDSIVSIDLYYMGIVFIGEMLTPGFYRVRF